MTDRQDEILTDDEWVERYKNLGDRLRQYFKDKYEAARQEGYEEGFAAGVASCKSDTSTSKKGASDE